MCRTVRKLVGQSMRLLAVFSGFGHFKQLRFRHFCITETPIVFSCIYRVFVCFGDFSSRFRCLKFQVFNYCQKISWSR